jgi:hypothetical protein
MATPFDYAVSLRVVHPTLDPERICNSLGMAPFRSWKSGTPRQTPTGTPLEGVYTSSYCSFDIADGDDGELARCIRAATERLEEHADFFREIRQTGGSAMFYIFWYPNGDTGEVFDVDLLLKIAQLGIDIGINVYDDRHPTAA